MEHLEEQDSLERMALMACEDRKEIQGALDPQDPWEDPDETETPERQDLLVPR